MVEESQPGTVLNLLSSRLPFYSSMTTLALTPYSPISIQAETCTVFPTTASCSYGIHQRTVVAPSSKRDMTMVNDSEREVERGKAPGRGIRPARTPIPAVVSKVHHRKNRDALNNDGKGSTRRFGVLLFPRDFYDITSNSQRAHSVVAATAEPANSIGVVSYLSEEGRSSIRREVVGVKNSRRENYQEDLGWMRHAIAEGGLGGHQVG
ncbi:hypothetical protein DL96DRAFT_1563565 [Flagelloscypha sp. PMI_526]|nr:hypothetical protein DL96DRAFT_1563565 [Flagelloscypha sp. PMI_526]